MSLRSTPKNKTVKLPKIDSSRRGWMKGDSERPMSTNKIEDLSKKLFSNLEQYERQKKT